MRYMVRVEEVDGSLEDIQGFSNKSKAVRLCLSLSKSAAFSDAARVWVDDTSNGIGIFKKEVKAA